ncbi:hypothetical protein HL273_20580 [Yersinia enterocolitica]|uniref:hypothetical protein n=1 Tax=Yersinia enterocolitica TaxID=630 RepID=UPI001C207507|nr:hypothetical protein [Yersinia enterocolitica]MBX9485249.1 hypothetical protein [Yersinia enterocolitica]NQS96468.1 hypothetical protein [Yersinia enterocolitica]NQT45663.1 hypothetical protein [Yersinia enterocolitica]NQU02328.1 hypothetical protein [Yersinia enterocolitica]HDM8448841.1 hypothetical protein [Yersinia enterocolitica]
MSEIKQYDTEVRLEAVMGTNHYGVHIHAMTKEDLHSKSDIAVELAWRDLLIERLTSENAVMLNLLTDISENHSEFVDESDDYMYASIPLDYVSEINTYVSRDVDAENPFIATDKALNEIKAQGVDEFADNWQGKESHSQISEMARRFAASLRSNS